MFLLSNIVGSLFLATEACLAYFAFSALTVECDPTDGQPTFPCAVDKLYNKNFLDIPVIGQICNFYPMLNVAAVPILNITLRNNLLDVIPIKQYLRRKNKCLCLIDDSKNSVKGLWSIILSIPVFIVVFLVDDVQDMVTVTGSLFGGFILLIFPAMLVTCARLKKPEETHGPNPNKSPFTSWFSVGFVYLWGAIVISSVIYLIASGGLGSH